MKTGGTVSASDKPGSLDFFAVAAPGLEEALAGELRQLPGCEHAAAVPGGVEWRGDLSSMMRANLWSRVATRIIARVAKIEAKRFPALRRRAAELPWEMFVPAGAALTISVSASRCRLWHGGAVEENLRLAIADRVSIAPDSSGTSDAPKIEARILARGLDDNWVLSVDSSGELLHRRGWRVENGAAPIRETLAAGVLRLCAWDPSTALADPMCGAGTFPIEAASVALGRAPGLERSFAFQQWAGFQSRAWQDLVDQARTAVRPAPAAAIVGADRDADAVARARRHAERAGVAHAIDFRVAETAAPLPPASKGLVVCNPPYGHRLAHPSAARRVYRAIGDLRRAQLANCDLVLLMPRALSPMATGLGAPAEQIPLQNGGLPVSLAIWRGRNLGS